MSETIDGCVYLISFPNGKRYVGMTKYSSPELRLRNHRKNDSLVGRALRKYDESEIEILARCTSWKELCELEKVYIASFNTKKPAGYNLTAGGDGSLGHSPTAKTRKKLSSKLWGNSRRLGIKFSRESLAKIQRGNARQSKRRAASIGLKKKWQDPVWREKMLGVLRPNNERKKTLCQNKQ